jgi:uncharacterized membrane protein YqjE
MTDRGPNSGTSSSPGFFHSLRGLLAILSSAFHTRLELFVAELEEERERLKQTLVLILLLFFGRNILGARLDRGHWLLSGSLSWHRHRCLP